MAVSTRKMDNAQNYQLDRRLYCASCDTCTVFAYHQPRQQLQAGMDSCRSKCRILSDGVIFAAYFFIFFIRSFLTGSLESGLSDPERYPVFVLYLQDDQGVPSEGKKRNMDTHSCAGAYQSVGGAGLYRCIYRSSCQLPDYGDRYMQYHVLYLAASAICA